jgi:uncharacterized protein (TIGR03435 family)
MCAGLALVSAVAVAQSPAEKPAFEVASVKPAAPPTPGTFMTGSSGGPGTPDPGQATFTNVTQRTLLRTAYDVQDYQISGPAWLESERYDIVAKVPKGVTKEQFRLMLQSLLAERFKLTLHRETKDLPRYELVVAKGGSKLKESAPAPAGEESAASSDGPGAPPPPPGGGFGPPPGPPPGGGAGFGPPSGGRGGMPPMQMGKDGFPKLPPGMGRGSAAIMMMNGRTRLVGSALSAAKLAKALASQLGRPVVDKTGFTGEYDVSLGFDPTGLAGTHGMMPPMMPSGGPGGGPGSGSDGPGANQPESEAANLFTAIQQQLGLKLEQKKGPLDLLVIDHSEKVPIAD